MHRPLHLSVNTMAYNRASIRQESLSLLALIHIYYLTDIDLEEAVGPFAKKYPLGGFSPRGVLPYMGYTGTCRWIGYGFWRLCPERGV